MSSPTKLDAIVTQNSTLRQLFRQAAAYRELGLGIKALLDEPLRRHIQVATVQGDTLILIADSPAWAAKLRYLTSDLRRRIAENTVFPEVRSIRVRVAKSGVPRQPDARRPKRPLSKLAVEELRCQAESLEDPVLREALLRLILRQGVLP
jgi:hypothetical protein